MMRTGLTTKSDLFCLNCPRRRAAYAKIFTHRSSLFRFQLCWQTPTPSHTVQFSIETRILMWQSCFSFLKHLTMIIRN